MRTCHSGRIYWAESIAENGDATIRKTNFKGEVEDKTQHVECKAVYDEYVTFKGELPKKCRLPI